MKVTINVTASDIKNGALWSYTRLRHKYGDEVVKYERKRCLNCPVAIALNRTFGQRCVAETYRLTIGEKVVRCPEIVSDWMYEFDLDRNHKPFDFDLEMDEGQGEPAPAPDPVVPANDISVVTGGDDKLGVAEQPEQHPS